MEAASLRERCFDDGRFAVRTFGNRTLPPPLQQRCLITYLHSPYDPCQRSRHRSPSWSRTDDPNISSDMYHRSVGAHHRLFMQLNRESMVVIPRTKMVMESENSCIRLEQLNINSSLAWLKSYHHIFLPQHPRGKQERAK